MTTRTWTGPMSHSTDASYMAWITDLFSNIEQLGLVHVPQTGEVAMPAAGLTKHPGSGWPHWRIYRFDDSLQATSPIFIRIECGTMAGSFSPGIRIACGSGVDGSGNLASDGASSPITAMTPNGWNSGADLYTSYACKLPGYFALCFKALSHGGQSTATIVISRTGNADGGYNGVGYFMLHPFNPSSGEAPCALRTMRLQAPKQQTTYSTAFSLSSGGNLLNSGGLAGEIEVALVFYNDPLTKPTASVCSVYEAEFARGTTFQAALVGSSTRTYMSLGNSGTRASADGAGRKTCLAILWE